MNNSTNLTLECLDGVPSVVELFAAFQLTHWLLLIIPIALWLMTIAVYVMNLRHTMEHGHKDTKGNVAALFTIYPVSSECNKDLHNQLMLILHFQIVSSAALIAIIVPKAFFFSDTLAHISFVIISYQFYR